MGRRPKRFFSDEVKRQAVDEYVSGRKSAAEIAAELGVVQGLLYKWRVQLDEKAKGARFEELEAEGHSAQDARRIRDLEAEIDEYKKKLAEQILINDLLKKLQPSSSQSVSAVTGLINTVKLSARSKKPAR